MSEETTSGSADHYFRPGQFLFREGETSRSMYIIRKGTVSIRKLKGSAYIEIARLYSNEVLGELSFFDRAPRSAAAVALTEVEVVEIHFSSLDKVYETMPPYLRTICASLAERLRRANDVIRRLKKEYVKEDGEEDADSALSATSAINQALQLENEDSGVKLPPDAAEEALKTAAGSGSKK